MTEFLVLLSVILSLGISAGVVYWLYKGMSGLGPSGRIGTVIRWTLCALVFFVLEPTLVGVFLRAFIGDSFPESN
jgi:hypothetical protein